MEFWYYLYMDERKTKRKKRSDRTHILYKIVVENMIYIGLTAKTQSTVLKSANLRFSKHLERARNESKSWPLYTALRKFGIDSVTMEILETVRGKAQAHSREVALIKALKPELNLASSTK